MSDVNATLPEVEVTAQRDPPAPAPAAPVASPTLFGRRWYLSVSGQAKSNGGLADVMNLSDFHIQFQVEQGQMMTPWRMEATIINVPLDLAAQVTAEYTDVTLWAGYQHARYGQLFAGQIGIALLNVAHRRAQYFLLDRALDELRQIAFFAAVLGEVGAHRDIGLL